MTKRPIKNKLCKSWLGYRDYASALEVIQVKRIGLVPFRWMFRQKDDLGKGKRKKGKRSRR
jgi:hypothetical protein